MQEQKFREIRSSFTPRIIILLFPYRWSEASHGWVVGLTCYYILLPEVPTRYILKLSDIILTLPNGNSSIYWALTPTSFCYFRKNLVWHEERNTFYVGVITTSIKLSLFSLYTLKRNWEWCTRTVCTGCVCVILFFNFSSLYHLKDTEESANYSTHFNFDISLD